MAHSLIIGMTESGKTTLAVQIANDLKKKAMKLLFMIQTFIRAGRGLKLFTMKKTDSTNYCIF